MIAARSQHKDPGPIYWKLSTSQTDSVAPSESWAPVYIGVVHARRHRICCCCGDRESRGQPHNNWHDMVFRHRHQEWFAWFQDRRSGSAYHVCSLSVIIVLQKISWPHVQFIIKSRTSGPLLEQICIGPLLKKKVIMQWRNIHMPKTGLRSPWIGIMSWLGLYGQPACHQEWSIAGVKAMELTEYVYCVLDTGELHLPIGSDSYWPLQASTMRLCHKQGSLHATLIITLSMHKDTWKY